MEEAIADLRQTIEAQTKRSSAIQAQLDHLIARLGL